METHSTEDEGKRRRVTRIAGWIFVALGVLQIILGNWPYGVFFLACAPFALWEKGLERLPKPARSLLVAAFAAFAVFLFVKMVADLSAVK